MWNRRYYYREKNKKAACWALIIILLPYIVTVFVNGPKIVTASKVDEMTIDVKGGGKMLRWKNIALEYWRGTCLSRI